MKVKTKPRAPGSGADAEPSWLAGLRSSISEEIQGVKEDLETSLDNRIGKALGIEVNDPKPKPNDKPEPKAKGAGDIDPANENTLEARLRRIEEENTKLRKAWQRKSISVPGLEDPKEKKNFSFARAIWALAHENKLGEAAWKHAGFELEVLKAARQVRPGIERTMSASDDEKGGFLVPEEIGADIIQFLDPNLMYQSLGGQLISDVEGSEPFTWNRESSVPDIYWGGESEDIEEGDIGYDQIRFTPHMARLMTKLTRRLMKNARIGGGVESAVRRRLQRALQNGLDSTAFFGTGGEFRPLGLVFQPGIRSAVANPASPANGGEVTYDLLQELITLVDESDALMGEPGFWFHPRLRKKIAGLMDGNSRPLFVDNLGQPGSTPRKGFRSDLLDYPFQTSSQVPTNLAKGTTTTGLSYLGFGDLSSAALVLWGGFELEATMEGDAFKKHEVHIKIVQDVDFGLMHPESFAVCSDVNATGTIGA